MSHKAKSDHLGYGSKFRKNFNLEFYFFNQKKYSRFSELKYLVLKNLRRS